MGASAEGAVLPRYLMLAGAMTAADLLTKTVATVWLRDGRFVELTDRLGFTLLYNTAGAGGNTVAGPHAWLVNVLLTVLALLLVAWVVQPLAAVHRGAVLALACVSGGAMGNLLSMLFGPRGVCDFLAVTLPSDVTIVMNGADLELWTGALLLAPVVRHLLRTLRLQRSRAALVS